MGFLQSDLEFTSHRHAQGYSDFSQHIPKAWIGECLLSTESVEIRRRRLPAEALLWLVIGLGFFRNRSIVRVLQSLGLYEGGPEMVASSAVTQGRQRLGPGPLQWLFHRMAAAWAHVEAGRDKFHGMPLYGIDGVTLKVPDTKANREAFGGPSNYAGECAHPVVRAVCLLGLRARVVAGAAFGTYHQHEQLYAAELLPELPKGALCLFDKGHYAAAVVSRLMQRGSHFLCRLPSAIDCKVIHVFSKDDCLVQVTLRRSVLKENPDLPESFVMRRIRIRSPRSTRKDGGTGRKGPAAARQYLATSLVNPTITADEIRRLYAERWELENANDEVKTLMLERQETLRSKSPRMVEQEIWGLLIGYNLVRHEMAQAARKAKVPPAQISFVTSLMLIQDEFVFLANAAPGSIPKQLAELRARVGRMVLPARRKRSYPRAVKAGRTRYPVKRKPAVRKRRRRKTALSERH